jgi:hypothetical protein
LACPTELSLACECSTVSAREGRPIALKDEDPSVFAPYLQCLYSHYVDTSSDLEMLAEIYVVGEMLMDLEFQDAVLDVFMYECEKREEYADMVLIGII